LTFMATLILSKRKKDNRNKVIAIWSPVAAGKTMVAVNLSVVLSEKVPTALVDLSSDGAIHTWLNCSETKSLKELTAGNPNECYFPVSVPGLRVYTFQPGEKPPFSGEASLLSAVSKALNDFYVVYDVSRDILKAANILHLADITLLVADYNIHGVFLLQKYLKQIKNPLLVVNRYFPERPEFSPEDILGLKAFYLPDSPREVFNSVFTGVPVVSVSPEFKSVFKRIRDEILRESQLLSFEKRPTVRTAEY